MNMDIAAMFKWLNENGEYRSLFEKAYPGAGVNADTLSRAIASFERTVVSNNSPFDRWVKGDKRAMSEQQVRGFQLFTGKANCAVCHSGPNFTDDGFHNVGLASFGKENPDLGRYAQKPLPINKGAFKTPTLRDVERTAPYFHDGSARDLTAVMEHYDSGGAVKQGISPNMKPLGLTRQEREDLVAFMKALTSPAAVVTLPQLPQ
jgi:cytochrome c peroxidase